MSFPSWPADVNQKFSYGSYREEIEDVVDSFAVDHGPPLESRATSVPTRLIAYEAIFTKLEYAALKIFWRDTISVVGTFERQHPLTSETHYFRFTAPPNIVGVDSFNRYRVSINLRLFD